MTQTYVDPATVIARLTWAEIRALRIGLSYETTQDWQPGKVLVNVQHTNPQGWLFALSTPSPYQDNDHGWAICDAGHWLYLARNGYSTRASEFLELSVLDSYVIQSLEAGIQLKLDYDQDSLERNRTALIPIMHNWDIPKVQNRISILEAARADLERLKEGLGVPV